MAALAARRGTFPGGTARSGRVVAQLLVIATVAISLSIWAVVLAGPYATVPRADSHTRAAATADGSGRSSRPLVGLETRHRGLLDLGRTDAVKYLMVQCHRGQFSNRLMCVKVGLHLARILKRVLVLPVFTDVAPVVDVSKYVSLECVRRNGQAVTFTEFREDLCHGVGLGVPSISDGGLVGHGAPPTSQHGSGGGRRSAGSMPSSPPPADEEDHATQRSFCNEGALLQLSDSYSLADYRGYQCWQRREDIRNARDLGVQVQGCTHVPPDNATTSYSLEQLKREFGNRPEKVLMFLDLFGVEVMPTREEIVGEVSEPGQMCGWMPAEQASLAADAVMQVLIPVEQRQQQALAVRAAVQGGAQEQAAAGSDPGPAGGAASAAAQGGGGGAVAAAAGGAGAAGALQAGGNTRALATSDPSAPLLYGRAPLRGTRKYMAVHLRRSDWFYYCAGKRNCFYSVTEVGAWLNRTASARGMDWIYVSTNADTREREMLRRAVSGRMLFWEDVLSAMRAFQRQAAALEARGQTVEDAGVASGLGAVLAAYSAVDGRSISELPLDDDLMVQMLEKAICMQADSFISSAHSTFSNQIRDFRNGGLSVWEREAVELKLGRDAIVAAVVSGAFYDPSVSRGRADPAVFICDDRDPQDQDLHRLPDLHNPNIFFAEAARHIGAIKARLLVLLGRGGDGAAAAAGTQAASMGSAGAATGEGHWSQELPQRPAGLLHALSAPWRWLQVLVLTFADGYAMAGANRFVEMYTGGRLVGLALQGRQHVPPEQLAACVEAGAARVGAVAVHVSMEGVPVEQQVLIMQALEARSSLQQITRLGGIGQEHASTFTLIWRLDGLQRRSEAAMWNSLPGFLERADKYALAKARVLFGNANTPLFEEVMGYRRLFGFDDARDGSCAGQQAPLAA